MTAAHQDVQAAADCCPGRVAISGRRLGKCVICRRLGGFVMLPAASLVKGLAECVHFTPLGAAGIGKSEGAKS